MCCSTPLFKFWSGSHHWRGGGEVNQRFAFSLASFVCFYWLFPLFLLLFNLQWASYSCLNALLYVFLLSDVSTTTAIIIITITIIIANITSSSLLSPSCAVPPLYSNFDQAATTDEEVVKSTKGLLSLLLLLFVSTDCFLYSSCFSICNGPVILAWMPGYMSSSCWRLHHHRHHHR